MSKISAQMRLLTRSPKHMMEHQATGRLPRVIEPESPLITLLERIGPRARQHISGVKLGPALGYQHSRTFENAESLYRWLKPDQWVPPHRDEAGQYKLACFRGPLTLAGLLGASHNYPRWLADDADRCVGPRQGEDAPSL